MAERNPNVLSGAIKGATGVAGETLKRTGSAARGATGGVNPAVDTVGEAVQGAATGAGDVVERAGGGGGRRTFREEIRQIVREAALEVLIPVARTATTKAATYAVARTPQLARDTVAPRLNAAIEEAGGPGELAKRALSSVSSARAGLLQEARARAEARRPWRERPVPVEESIDVAVPVDSAYDRFTEFEEYANVLSHGEIVDEREDERIDWTRTDGVDASALITFHRLGDRLTRVMVDYDHHPQGMVERAGSLLHTTPRRLTADLMRFKAYAEMSAEDGEPDDEAADTPTRPGEDG
jgi:uncharacterized membrane protein